MTPPLPPMERRPVRVVDQHESPPPVDVRVHGFVERLFGALPPWGKVIIFAGLTFGLGTGAGIAGLAKVLGIQTAALASADKAELKADIAAGVKAQQTAAALAAVRDADFKKLLESLQSGQSIQGAKLSAIARQLSKRTRASDTP